MTRTGPIAAAAFSWDVCRGREDAVYLVQHDWLAETNRLEHPCAYHTTVNHY
jgi:hypothetical protein